MAAGVIVDAWLTPTGNPVVGVVTDAVETAIHTR